MTLAGRPTIIVGGVSRLWRGHDADFRPARRLSIDAFLDLLIAVAERDAAHGKRPAPITIEQSIQFFVVSGDAKFMLGFAIPRLQFMVINGPIATDTEFAFQLEIARDESGSIAAPRPSASANHSIISGLERILARVGIFVIVLRIISLVRELPLRLFRDRGEESAFEVHVRRIHVTPIALSIHSMMKLNSLPVCDFVVASLEDQDLAVMVILDQLPSAQGTCNAGSDDNNFVLVCHGCLHRTCVGYASFQRFCVLPGRHLISIAADVRMTTMPSVTSGGWSRLNCLTAASVSPSKLPLAPTPSLAWICFTSSPVSPRRSVDRPEESIPGFWIQ